MEDTVFKALFEYSSLGILISNKEGVIERANPFLGEMFGYNVEELVGQKVEIFLPSCLWERHIKQREDYNLNPSHRPMGVGMDLKAVKKNGDEIPVEVSISYYEDQGRRHIINFVSDITDRKKTEEKLKKLMEELEEKVQERTLELSQALVELNHINKSLSSEVEQRKLAEEKTRLALNKEIELNEMKSRFVSMASHEFRTPLGGILTSASLIERYGSVDDESKRLRHVQTIKKAVKNLTAILNDFLSLDKLDQGKVGANPIKFRLNEFVKATVAELEDLLQEGQRIEYEYNFNEVEIFQDKDMFRNVLVNLLSNAMKYSPTESLIKVVAELQASQVKIDVIDQGVGIPENEQKYLFTRFFRANNVSTIQGTGLGLNIVKRYLDLLGGYIQFNSQENIGTTFSIIIPLEL